MGGRFRLDGVLGRGAAGTVYLAKDEVLDEVVALKVLAPTLASQPEFRARFRTESITLANLSHPNVVRVHDYFEDEAGAYLVMDRVDGPSLRQLLAAYGRPFRSRLTHEKGLLHGDVKPENVLVDMAGDSKLTDFGQAIPIGSVATGGTGAYMSPETLGGLLVAHAGEDVEVEVHLLGAHAANVEREIRTEAVRRRLGVVAEHGRGEGQHLEVRHAAARGVHA